MTDIQVESLPAAIQAAPMFRELPEGELRRIEAVAKLRELRRGDVLWHAGDPAKALVTIVEGHVKIVRHGAGGDVLLEIFGPGEQVGTIAVYNRLPYPASAIALGPSTLLLVPAAEFFALLERRPHLMRSLIGELTRIHMSLARRLEEGKGQHLEARIAQLFLSLAERMGIADDAGTVIPVALSRQEVGQMVDTSVESSIRVLSRWNRDGVLLSEPGRFVIPSREVLRAIAEGGAEG
jgi:CRP/FNR family transcriptional regulator, nitrogen oxide reductase regulator